MTLLTPAARATLPSTLPAWTVDPARDALVRTLRFPDFTAAWAFLTEVAAVAEAQDHHPDWRNAYGLVEIALTTHDAGGLTARDLALAQAIDAILARSAGGADGGSR